jgi:hypothetical protein
VQLPLLQAALPCVGASQMVPQAPQSFGSFSVSTQVEPSQLEKPSAHWMPQAPSAHVREPFVGIGHAFEQLPQWDALVWVSTQALPHFVRPSEQASLHRPRSQTRPPVQATSQPPQFAGSFEVSMQVPSQFENGSSQVTPQTPSVQLGAPFGGIGQLLPHAPQFATSLDVSTQTSPQAT